MQGLIVASDPGTMAAMVRLCLDGTDLGSAARAALAMGAERQGAEETETTLAHALILAAEGRVDHAAVIRALGGGWVGQEALAIGLYVALVAPSFADAIRLAANYGGDSDSTASIAGQLYGAWKGADELLHCWVRRLDALDPLLALSAQAHSENGDRTDHRSGSPHTRFRFFQPTATFSGPPDQIAAYSRRQQELLWRLHARLAQLTGRAAEEIAEDMRRGRYLDARMPKWAGTDADGTHKKLAAMDPVTAPRRGSSGGLDFVDEAVVERCSPESQASLRNVVAMTGSRSTSPIGRRLDRHRSDGYLLREARAEFSRPPGVHTMVLGRMFALPLDSFFASEGACPRPSAVCRRVALILPLAINLLTLTALAFASPPDPTWIPGIYDDADYDDVVMMLTDMSKGTDPPARLVQVKPCPILVGLIRPVVTWASALTASLALHFRSPPLL